MIPAPRPLPPAAPTARRAAAVTAALARHGILPRDSADRPGPFAARGIVRAFEELGPTFVKLGQLVASSPGIFSERVSRAFDRCRDHVAPLPFASIAAVIESSQGSPLRETFAWIDETPLSSASIAQVHAARLPDGAEVVVKVVRPRVREVVAADLALLELGSRLTRRLMPQAAGMTLADVVAEFRRTITEELDLRVEAAYQRRMREVLAACGSGEVVAPAVVAELSTEDVLVAERIHGVRFDDAESVRRSGLNAVDLLHHAIRTVQESAIVHGLFHGDLHSANMLVLPDGRLAYVDFGIMGRLDPASSLDLGRFFAGMLLGDHAFVVQALDGLGVLPPTVSRARLEADLRNGASRIFSRTLTGFEMGAVIRLALRLAIRHRARLPRQLALLAKQLLYLDGAARTLAPHADLMAEALEILLYFQHRYPDLAGELLPPAVLRELELDGPDALYRHAPGRQVPSARRDGTRDDR